MKPTDFKHSNPGIITVTWLLLVVMFMFSCAGSGSSQKGKTPRNFPQDVKDFIERRDRCDQWRAEEENMADPERASFLINKMMQDCMGTDFDLKSLRRKYKDNAEIIENLSKYEDNVESNK